MQLLASNRKQRLGRASSFIQEKDKLKMQKFNSAITPETIQKQNSMEVTRHSYLSKA